MGSMLALVAYPVLIEPGLTLGAQAQSWAIGYAALSVSVLDVRCFCSGETCGVIMRGQEWHFFEIDPAIETFARRAECFSFLKGSKA
jgi:hypothetical protein